MPRVRKVIDAPELDTELLDQDDMANLANIRELREVVRWVGRTIVTRNANGRQSDKFCALCQKSKLHKEPCRHADIWRLAGIDL